MKENIILLLLKFLFILIILPKSIQMMIILMVFLYIIISNKGVIVIEKEAYPFILLGFLHLFSILINCIGDFTLSRVIAAVNTALLWILGGFFLSYSSKKKLDRNKVNRIMYNNMLILILFSFAMIISQLLKLPTISILSRSLTGGDWIDGEETIRLMAFMEYSNLISLFYFLAFPFAYEYIKENKSVIFQTLFLIVSILPVILNHSRIGILLAIIQLIIMLPKVMAISKKRITYISVLFFSILIIFFAVNYSSIINSIENLINSRQGSTATRSIIYKTSIIKTINKSPVIGCGIKEYLGEYPLGSHSTYIGFFYKTGIIGFIIGMMGIINLALKIIKNNKKAFLPILCFLLMLILEDLDGANWLIILFFILSGNLLNRNNTEGKNEKNINNSSSI